MVDRVGTQALYQRTIDDIGRAQVNIAELRDQISSGRAASTFTELGVQTTRVLDLESSLRTTKRFVQGNETVVTRLKTMDLAVSQVEQIAEDFAKQLVLERSSSGENFNITEYARTAMAQVADSLNTRLTGRALFAGGKTNLDPVPVNALFTSNMVNGQPSANYYQGDNLTLSVRATEELELEYGIKANDVAFQKLIGSLNKAIDSESAGGGDVDVEQAIDLVNDAVTELARVRNQINTDIITLESVNEQHTRVELQLNEVLDNTVATDVVEATIQVSLNEAVLTATMQTFGRLSQLSLVDYLR